MNENITIVLTRQEAVQVAQAVPISGEEFPGYGEPTPERKEQVDAAISGREKIEKALL